MTASARRALAIEQYAEGTGRLDARAALHELFSTAGQPWHRWVFDQMGLWPEERVVEVGAGTGLLWTTNADRSGDLRRLHLTDLSQAMCRRLRTDLGPAPVVLRADAERLPFAAGVADVVVANQMLYHVPDPLRALAEMRRVLRPGGRAVIATNGRDHMRESRQLAAAAGLESPNAEPMHGGFVLEDAPAMVATAFAEVAVVPYDDGLLVTEAAPLVDYIASYTPMATTERDRLTAVIDERLRAGPIAITKSAGLLLARP